MSSPPVARCAGGCLGNPCISPRPILRCARVLAEAGCWSATASSSAIEDAVWCDARRGIFATGAYPMPLCTIKRRLSGRRRPEGCRLSGDREVNSNSRSTARVPFSTCAGGGETQRPASRIIRALGMAPRRSALTAPPDARRISTMPAKVRLSAAWQKRNLSGRHALVGSGAAGDDLVGRMRRAKSHGFAKLPLRDGHGLPDDGASRWGQPPAAECSPAYDMRAAPLASAEIITLVPNRFASNEVPSETA